MTAATAPARHFAVVPPPGYARWILVAVPAAAWLLAMRRGMPDDAAGLALTGTVLLAAATLSFWSLQRRDVALEGDTLIVRSAMLTRRVGLDALDPRHARIVDLAEYAGLQPRLRLLGMSLPGFRAGWFRRRSGGRGFYLLTTPRRVLWLPVRDAPPLLLSLVHAEELLDALGRG